MISLNVAEESNGNLESHRKNLGLHVIDSSLEIMHVNSPQVHGDGTVNLWVDPMATIEIVNNAMSPKSNNVPGLHNTTSLDPQNLAQNVGGECSKRPHGRPKKSQTPRPNNGRLGDEEANETWKVAKALGINAFDEEAVIAELRKSKRLQLLEGNNPNTTKNC